MLHVHDLRETRVFQEAKEEGLKEGLKEGVEKGIKEGFTIAKMAAQKKSAAEIAAALNLDTEMVRRLLAVNTNGE